MKSILILLVTFSLPLTASAKNKTTRIEKIGPDSGSALTEELNTSPNPVPRSEENNRDQALIKNGSEKQEEQEAPAFEKGPYDQDGQFTYPKKETTEEIP